MSGKNCLLDTNIVIGLFASEALIIENIKSAASKIFIPSIVFGELFYGAEQSSRKDENKKKIESLSQVSLTVECDLETARFYGKIKSQLKAKGTPIPENDIWIAAISQQYQFTLITRDRHFNSIESLLVEKW